jgi:dsRNA-specific ribonuclease
MSCDTPTGYFGWTPSDIKLGIYFGSRGDDFKKLISSLLRKGGLKSRYIKMLTDDEAMKIYGCAFTSELVDPVNNYQVLEQVGDLSANKFIVNYFYNRFPQLDCSDGVKVVARLRINYGAMESFCEIASKLGFWKFISATEDLRQRKMKPLLEDVFEAFLGATERILDSRKSVGVGYGIVYNILSSIFNEMDISLRYENLYDAKTRLKELFDLYGSSLGPLIYKEQKNDVLRVATVFRVQGGKYHERKDAYNNIIVNKNRIIGGQYIKIGEGTAYQKADAQQNAASAALKTLKRQGWSKPVLEVYKRFDDDDMKIVSIDTPTINNLWGSDINALQSTKEKSKYQSKYQSTPLALYCRTRNLDGVKTCINLGADSSISDSEGMYPTDLLFIGKKDEKLVKRIISIMFSKKDTLMMHRQVFTVYFTDYVDKYFGKIIDKLVLID